MNQENKFNSSSPIKLSKKDSSDFSFYATPKLKQSIYNTKSPLRCALKKSRRRECTPEYSPPHSTHRLASKCATDLKQSSRVLIFPDKKQTFSEKEPKNKFLGLIEESINDLNDNYYGILGSQNTPNIIFRNLFPNREEDGIEESKFVKPDDEITFDEDRSFSIFNDIYMLKDALINENTRKEILSQMVN